MARWGRKGVSWYLSQWLSGKGQRAYSASSWKRKQWTIQPTSAAKKKPSVFKSRPKTASISWSQLRIHRDADQPASSFPPSSKLTARTVRKKGGWKRGLLIAFILMFIFAVPSFVFIEKNIRQPLMHVAKIRIKQVATQAINGAITEQVAQRAASEELIEWKMDSKGKISGFMLNYNEHMRITSSTIQTVKTSLSEIQHMPERIPLGHALDSAIISTYGPKIPVTFEPLGAVKVELNTREKNAAINMVLVEVYIKVITEVAIIIPFDTEPEIVEAEIPISYLLVVGDVPMYYYDSSGKPIGESAPQAPNISVPLHSGQGISSDPSNTENKDGNAADVEEINDEQSVSSFSLTP